MRNNHAGQAFSFIIHGQIQGSIIQCTRLEKNVYDIHIPDNMKESSTARRYDLVIFDMDGTIADTSPGIFDTIKLVAKQMGFRIPTDEELRQKSSGRLNEDFEGLFEIDKDTANEALMLFGRLYEEHGQMNCAPYPGLKQLISDIHDAGIKLSVATMKLQDTSEIQLQDWGMLDYFDSVNGVSMFVQTSKTDLIENAMNHAGVPKERTLMIGDTGNDLTGAMNCGTDFIAVTYGFGFTREVCESKGLKFAGDADGLRRQIL